METNHTEDQSRTIWPSEHRWSITTGSTITCAICETRGLASLEAEDHGGEIALRFRCQHGHTWSVRLELEESVCVPHLCDPRRRDGEKAAIPWSRSMDGMMHRISDWDEPGALHIEHFDSDDRRKDSKP